MRWISKRRRVRKWLVLALLLTGVTVVSGCRELGFYGQAIKGQYQIFSHQQPIDKLIADPQTPAELRQQLELIRKLCVFADRELKLPVDGHYRTYADVHRPYVVWNVQAARQFSLSPKTWWYPLVGSLEYRGYFSESGARQSADGLWAKGYDIYVDGVDAYSTLGWFKDPVLNTFVDRPEPALAEVIFHELGHQRVFARGDTDFNEAYATTVGQEGARRWLRTEGNTNSYETYMVSIRRNDQFVHLVLNARTQLEKIYGDKRDKEGKVTAAKKLPAPPDQLEKQKRQVLEKLRSDYAGLKSQWNGYAGYDTWMARDLNNAQLNTIANYYDYLPGFEQLLKLNGGDMEKFYQAVERLAKISKEKRHQSLRELAEGKGSQP